MNSKVNWQSIWITRKQDINFNFNKCLTSGEITIKSNIKFLTSFDFDELYKYLFNV